jgi:hypothetical protein
MLDSLVRVSRRGKEDHFVRALACAMPRSRQQQKMASFRCKHPTSWPNVSCGHRTGPDQARQRAAPLSQSPGEVRLCRQHWSTSVPFQQFQALFDSLFKVLFIFPSRYLFAIGLPPIFSFRWNLPPTLSCNPKQLDSLRADRTPGSPATDGVVTLHDALFQGTWTGCLNGHTSVDYNSPKRLPL